MRPFSDVFFLQKETELADCYRLDNVKRHSAAGEGVVTTYPCLSAIYILVCLHVLLSHQRRFYVNLTVTL